MKFFSTSLTLFFILLASSSQAMDKRCETTGKLALSGYIGVLVGLGKGDRSDVINKTNDGRLLVGFYRDLGCEMPPLYTAIECVHKATNEVKNKNSTIAEVADQCLLNAGIRSQ